MANDAFTPMTWKIYKPGKFERLMTSIELYFKSTLLTAETLRRHRVALQHHNISKACKNGNFILLYTDNDVRLAVYTGWDVGDYVHHLSLPREKKLIVRNCIGMLKRQ